MKKIYHIFDNIKNVSSRTSKESILQENINNSLFIDVLLFVYNPYIVTGLSTKKMNKKVDINTENSVNDLNELINYLKSNGTGRDIDIAVVNNFINSLDNVDLQGFVRDISTKKLKIGVTSSTINKICGKDTIPSFKLMLAESYDKKEDKVTGHFYITLKLDGNRAIAIKSNGTVSFFTRKGIEIEGLSEITKEMKYLPDNRVYDGELILENKDNLASDDLFRATQKVVRKDGEKKSLQFHIFDTVTIEEFKNGESSDIYSDRRIRLNTYNESIKKNDMKFLHILPVLYEGSDKSQIKRLLKWSENSGYEGLMLNISDRNYVTKRTDGLLKVKKFITVDLICLSIEEGEGRNTGKLGRINVQYKEDSIVGCGTGFSDEQRKYYWDNQEEIVGKIIEVKYFEESKDEKTQKPSLRFPVFIQVREDKTIDDVNYE